LTVVHAGFEIKESLHEMQAFSHFEAV